MGLVSHKVRKEDIKPGDHIYAWRACYTYSHHGIYVGGNKVVHFTAPEDGGLLTSSIQSSASYCCPSSSYGGSNLSNSSSQSSSSYGCPTSSYGGSNLSTSSNQSSTSSGCPSSSYGGSNLRTSSRDSSASYGHPLPCPSYPDCGFRQPDSGVVLSCIDCFLGKGSARLFKYGVTVFSFHVKRPGTCTTAQTDSSETVIHRATYLLRNGFGNYNMLLNNCEDFAIYCKTGLIDTTGLGRSGQVSSVAGAAALSVALLAKVIRGAVGVVSNPVATVGVAVGAGLYCMVRHGQDIGVRSDVIKVPVEELVVYGRS